jgi:hypothetical protein
VSRFLDTAAGLLEAAVAARQVSGQVNGQNNGPAAGVTVLVDNGGGLTLLTQNAQNDWPLEALARERGAREAYRVHQRDGRLFVEGRAGAKACLLSAASPDEAARALRHFNGHFHEPVPLLSSLALSSLPPRQLPPASNSYGPNLDLYSIAALPATQ